MSKLIPVSEIKSKPLEFMVENFNKIDWNSAQYAYNSKEFKLSAPKANALIKLMMPKIISTNLKGLDFASLVVALKEFLLTGHNLLDVKGMNCGHSWRRTTSTLDKFNEELSREVNKVLYRVDMSQFSTIENIIICTISTIGEFTSIGNNESVPSYDVVNDDTTDIIQNHKEVNSFSYKKYGISKSSAVESYNTMHEIVLEKIKMFKALKDHAGTGILGWSQQKVTIHLRQKLGYPNKCYYSLGSYLDQWVAHLKASGVIDTTKLSSGEKAERKLKENMASQEDLFKVFKSGSKSAAINSIKKMGIETLILVMTSELKCIENRMEDCLEKIVARTIDVLEGGQKSIKFIKSLKVNKESRQEHYKVLIDFLRKYGSLALLKEEWLMSNVSLATGEIVKEYLLAKGMREHPHHKDELQETRIYFGEGFFDKVVAPFSAEFLGLHPCVNAEIIKRMNVEDQVKTFKDGVRVWAKDMDKIFKDIPYETLKGLLKDNERQQYFAVRVAKEKDLDYLKELLSSYQKIDPVLYRLFSFSEKIEILNTLNKNQKDDNGYKRVHQNCWTLEKIFTKDELGLFFDKCLEEEMYSPYMVEVIGHVKPETLEEIILSKKEIMHPDIAGSIVHRAVHSNIKIVEHLFKIEAIIACRVWRIDDKDEKKIYESYYRTFSSREVAEEILGKELVLEEDTLGHLLTDEEKEQNADSDITFFRKNLQHMSDDFVAKFKDAEMYKRYVGNRTYRENRTFSEQLNARLKKIQEAQLKDVA